MLGALCMVYNVLSAYCMVYNVLDAVCPLLCVCMCLGHQTGRAMTSVVLAATLSVSRTALYINNSFLLYTQGMIHEHVLMTNGCRSLELSLQCYCIYHEISDE